MTASTNAAIAATETDVTSRPISFLAGSPMGEGFFDGPSEPSLDEIMEDEVLHRVMASDGVRREHLVALIDDVRGRLSGRG